MRRHIAIILGSDENAYGCARMLYELEAERSLVLCAKALPATSHSGILERRVIPELDSPSVFRRTLEHTFKSLKNVAERITVIPCSDYYAELLIKNRALCEKYVSNPIPTERCYERFSTKAAFKRLCEELEISHPKTEIIIPSAELGQKKERSFPLVLKPSNSNSFEYLHSKIENKRKVYICENDGELQKALEDFALEGYNAPAVIQEYIGGDERSYRVVNAYCDREGRARIVGVGRPLLEYKNHAMIGNYAAVRSVKDRKLCDIAARILEKIGYVGFANFDVKIAPETNDYVFLELNPRQGRSSYYVRASGENLMGAMYEDAVLDKEYTGLRYAEEDGVWINEPIGVIRREMNERGLPSDDLDGVSAVKALSLGYDFNIPRAFTLIRRNLGAYTRKI